MKMAITSTTSKKSIDKTSRFDAKVFMPDYLKIEERLKKLPYRYLGEIVGEYTNGAEARVFEKEGIPYIRVSNTSRDFFVDFNDIKFISKESHKEHGKKYRLSKNDLLLNRSGTLGFCQVVNFKTALFSSHNIKLSKIKVNPYFLCCFLNSHYGKEQIFRYSNGAVIPEINHLGLDLIQVPIFSDQFQDAIEAAIKEAQKVDEQSKAAYQKAEQMLLGELGLLNHAHKLALAFTCLKSEVDEAGRFDAEYYPPAYKTINTKIESYKEGSDIAGNIVNWKKGIEVGSAAYADDGRVFIRVSDFSIHGIDQPAKKISLSLFAEIKKDFQPQSGEILFTKDGTIGMAHVLKESIEGVVSSAFLRLSLKNKYKHFEKECLALILNSIVCKSQIEQLSGGAIIAHLKPSDFEKIKIPLIDKKIQAKIAAMVQESYELRAESKALLEKAKRTVESEIEKHSKQ